MKKHLFRLGNIKYLEISERARRILDDEDIQKIIDDTNDELNEYGDSFAHYVGAEGSRLFTKGTYVDYELMLNDILFID